MARRKAANQADEKIIDSSGNVFVDLGFDKGEAEVLKMRAEVMLRIEAQLKALGWTSSRGGQAAAHQGYEVGS
jgi:hypothetical protein